MLKKNIYFSYFFFIFNIYISNYIIKILYINISIFLIFEIF